MKRREEKRQERFRRMRPYIGRHLFGAAAAAVVVVMALCGGWPVYEGVAQVDDAADDAILTVGRCIEVNTSVSPLEETLIKEDIIEDDLLQTKVTNGMCEDMLDRIPDGTPVQRLVAAQSYMQEIKLIKGAIRRAASLAAAKGTDRHLLAARPPVVAWTVVAAVQDAAEAQYPDGERPSPSPPPGPSPSPPPGPSPSPPPEDGSEVTPTTKQAATIADCSELSGAEPSYEEALAQCEAAAEKAGASYLEAAAGARCGLEVDVLDDEVENTSGMYVIKPVIPKEMRNRETKQAGLLVSPATKKRFQEIRQKHEVIAEASESNSGCVVLTDRMKATLVSLEPLEELDIDRHQTDDIRELSANRDTRWGWAITANQTGEQSLLLDLRYAISREGSEFRSLKEPVYDGAIKVTPLQGDSTQKATEQEATERPWWRRIWRIFERIFGV
jgi:hypothetical protein